ncbi:hypothetical protein BV20DRAFT_973826 [Pilatotrama ljubarskyi]|nr:hypothetical protein BV20DRAFT_973826 [Pilatotrama ljubarskyi]
MKPSHAVTPLPRPEDAMDTGFVDESPPPPYDVPGAPLTATLSLQDVRVSPQQQPSASSVVYEQRLGPLPPVRTTPEAAAALTSSLQARQVSYNPCRLAQAASSSSASSSSVPSPVSPSSYSFPYTGDASSSSSGSHSASRPRPSSSIQRHIPSGPSVADALAQPQPPSFARRPPSDVPYGPFPPATHFAHSDDLTRGFPMTPPTCPCAPHPHPFTTHDVHEGDWARFLEDVKRAGGLKPVNALIADAAPGAVSIGIIGGYLAGKALKAHVKRKRKSPVADVIEIWNRRFFHPRCMDVVLAQGVLTYTGPPIDPPDMVRPAAGKKDKHVRVIEDRSDDEESGSAGLRLQEVDAVVDKVGEHLARPRAEKRGRFAFGWDLKHSARERWRLVVSYKPPVL